jgi:hypothetical protein
VDLIQVDDVQLEAAKTGFHFAPNRFRFETLADLAPFVPHPLAFREDVRPVGTSSQRAGDDFFRMPQAVNGSRVDPVDAAVERGLNGCDRLVVVLRSPGKSPSAAANGPRTHTDARDHHVGIPQPFRFHP